MIKNDWDKHIYIYYEKKNDWDKLLKLELVLQSGYWGSGSMDPEPGRCRRTDGKKWRCSRDVVGGHKYCERHIHRGRNRSRKPVENNHPTVVATTIANSAASNANNNNYDDGAGVPVLLKTNIDPQPVTTNGSGGTIFGIPGPSHSFDFLHFNQR